MIITRIKISSFLAFRLGKLIDCVLPGNSLAYFVLSYNTKVKTEIRVNTLK